MIEEKTKGIDNLKEEKSISGLKSHEEWAKEYKAAKEIQRQKIQAGRRPSIYLEMSTEDTAYRRVVESIEKF